MRASLVRSQDGFCISEGPTNKEFHVIEVWESKDQFDRCNRDIIWPPVSLGQHYWIGYVPLCREPARTR